VNPATGRDVKISGALGKKILAGKIGGEAKRPPKKIKPQPKTIMGQLATMIGLI
jgi:hypothetical protein